MAEDKQKYSDKIASIETSIYHFGERLDGFQKETVLKFTEITGTLNEISRSGRTQWGVIATWTIGLLTVAATGLTIIGYLALTPVQERQRSNTTKIEQNEKHTESALVKILEIFDAKITKVDERLDEHMGDGHPDKVEVKTVANKESILRLDESLQREMRILDSNSEKQITALDERLQNEMRLLDDSQAERINAMEERLKMVEKWQYDREGVPERIKGLEREVFKGKGNE